MTVWLAASLVLAIHGEQIREHGGLGGVRDIGLLDGALARPQRRAAYSTPDIPELAALYALGIARNHPFLDGNKRTAHVAMETILELNGFGLAAADDEALVAMQRMAGTPDDEAVFIAWVREWVRPAR